MSLTTRPRPKTHQKKRQAQHHRRGKDYVKAYLPYLPMFAIVGAGGIINQVWTVSSSIALAAPSGSSPAVTRLAVITGDKSNTLLDAVLAITAVALAIFVITHWYRFHRMLNRGEAFVANHPWFDVSLVFIITAGVVLTRS